MAKNVDVVVVGAGFAEQREPFALPDDVEGGDDDEQHYNFRKLLN
jgi:hypothetical protein